MSNLKAINQALEKAKSPKQIFTLDFVQERAVKNYQAVTGRNDGVNWYEGEVLAIMQIFAQKPEYAKCDKMSIWGCLMEAGRKGLSIAEGHVDLVPYGTILKAEPNYKGMRKRLRDMPEIKFVNEAQVVWKDEPFVHDKINNKVIKHEAGDPPKDTTLNNIKAAYVRIEFNERELYSKDGKFVDVVMYQHELIAARNKSKNKSENGPWNLNANEMCKKSVLKRADKAYYNKTMAEVADDQFKATMNLKADPEEETVDTPHEEVEMQEEVPVETVETEEVAEPVKKQEKTKKKSGMSDFLEGE